MHLQIAVSSLTRMKVFGPAVRSVKDPRMKEGSYELNRNKGSPELGLSKGDISSLYPSCSSDFLSKPVSFPAVHRMCHCMCHHPSDFNKDEMNRATSTLKN